ncbi:MAG: DUF1850 domain-containing protein [Synergistaceae bacterium]|jgi:hypothetical protein|nr:DUF1850 domain-containing protein [Synergistaceae bacterium]
MKHAGNRPWAGTAIFRILVIVICGMIFAPYLPVNYFTITERGRTIFSCPVPNAYPFVTTYIHSLQLTPVKDDYRFVNGKIWTWEEWTQSHNAGLPSVTPPHAVLVLSPPWMINRGGRFVHDVINYRIGNERFGRNTWLLRPWNEIKIFEKYPSYRVVMEASAAPLKDARTAGFDTIGEMPGADKRIVSF